jgi:hypothetical protein
MFFGNTKTDARGRIINTELPFKKLEHIKRHLLSPKIDLDNNVPPTFLKGLHEKIAFTSYSRSGNTLLRKYLENITGVVTGSDGDLRHSLHF